MPLHEELMKDPEFARSYNAVQGVEAPYIIDLRAICNMIGYGRVIQLAEGWMEVANPGWVMSHHMVAIEADADQRERTK